MNYNDFLDWLHPHLVTLLDALLTIVVGLIGLGLKRLWQAALAWFYAHTNVANQAWIESLAKEAYAFAEKYYISKGGDEKLNAAINYVMGKINLQTIGLTREDIQGAVQKAWQDYNNQSKKQAV